MKVILGKITYPKSEAIIIPANTKGLMNRGIQKDIVKDGFQKVAKLAKKHAKGTEVGDFFVTDSGRLKRRKCKFIYHAVIKRLPGDMFSANIVRSTLDKIFKELVHSEISSVSICGFGVEHGEIDKHMAAYILLDILKRYDRSLDIKIIDTDKEFIKIVNDNLRKQE